MTTSKERDYYTVAEVAEILNVSHSTVWRWIKAGKLPAYRAGGRNLRVKQGDVHLMPLTEAESRPYESLTLDQARVLLSRKPSSEELNRRRASAVRTRENFKNRPRVHLESDELVRLSRDKDAWYELDEPDSSA